ncbi:MAG: hypothetical protein ACHP7B_06780, partial [Burkholderiales bacterium]
YANWPAREEFQRMKRRDFLGSCALLSGIASLAFAEPGGESARRRRCARVVAGPAPQPLACVALEHDAARDELYALGTIGAEQFGPFFEKYAMKLSLEYGSVERARAPITGETVMRELTSYCRNTIEC